MDQSHFSSDAPGKLVPTVAWELIRQNGKLIPNKAHGLAFIPNPLPPALDWIQTLGRLEKPLRLAERAIASLNGQAKGLENPDLLLAPFLRREARLSSQIENTIATPLEVALVESGEESEKPDPQEVVNYIHALRLGMARDDLPLTTRLFHDMHRTLLSNVKRDRGERVMPGEYRKTQNYIGSHRSDGSVLFHEAKFVPPPPGQPMLDAIRSLEATLNTPSATLPELVVIALTHYQFECIHPYEDGNGRLGRLMIPLLLCRHELLEKPYVYMSAYLERHDYRYRELLLRVSTHGDWESWLRFFLEGLTEQALDSEERVDRLLTLWNEYAEMVTGKRTSSLQRKLIDYLFVTPVVTIPQIRKVLNISNTAARKHVLAMKDLGILEEGPVRRKTQIYVAVRILDVAEEDIEFSE